MKSYRIIVFSIWISVSMAGLVSCELFGLDFQDSYKYDYEAGMSDNRVHMSTWEFIQSRTDLFSLLIEGIKYAEMESYFEESEATYLLLTNTAFTRAENGYFALHQFQATDDQTGELLFDEQGQPIMYSPVSLIYYPVEQIKELLLYHIVQGAWTWSNAPAEPTWFQSYAAADTAQVNIYLKKERNPSLRFNDFNGHYRGNTTARTSNLLSDEGSYMHVLEYWMDRPTRREIFGYGN